VLLATNTIILMRTRHQHREEKNKGEERRRKEDEERRRKGEGRKGRTGKNAQGSGSVVGGDGDETISFTEAEASVECSPTSTRGY